MRRFLNAAGEKGSCALGEPDGKSAVEISRVRNSSSFRELGNCIVWVFEGVLGLEKKLNRDAAGVAVVEALPGGDMLEFESRDGSVGLFFSFAPCLSGLGSREERFVEAGVKSCSMIGIPTDTGADDPVNQDARPLRGAASFITPSLSPVSVGMKSFSPLSPPTSCLVFSLFRSGLLDFADGRKGSRDVSDRWCVRGCRAG
jgi:hypothetical protein